MESLLAVSFLVFSDAHFSVDSKPSDLRWFPGIVNVLGYKTPRADGFLGQLDFQTQTNLKEALQHAAKHGPFDGVISLGDNTPGTQERGIISEATRQEALAFLREVEDALRLPSSARRIWVPGGHDLGYIGKVGIKEKGGPSSQSLEAFRQIYGPPYGAADLNDSFRIIWLTGESFLLSKRSDRVSGRADLAFLEKEKQAEVEFLRRELAGSRKKFFLAIHQPEALSNELREAIEPHLNRLVATFCGHYHGRKSAEFIKTFSPSNRKLFRKYRIQVVPSTWGAWIPYPFCKTMDAGWAKLILEGEKAKLLIYHTGKERPKTVILH